MLLRKLLYSSHFDYFTCLSEFRCSEDKDLQQLATFTDRCQYQQHKNSYVTRNMQVYVTFSENTFDQ